jgi:hypothetical protein
LSAQTARKEDREEPEQAENNRRKQKQSIQSKFSVCHQHDIRHVSGIGKGSPSEPPIPLATHTLKFSVFLTKTKNGGITTILAKMLPFCWPFIQNK